MAPELNLDELSRELATLSADRRQLLEKLLIQQGVDPDRLPIPRLDGNEPAPLSFGQEQLWVIERFEPGQSVYHMAAALELAGTLDVCRLASCLTQLIERHASLRTRFEERAGRPVQIEVPIQPIEVEPSPTESRRAALERAVAEVTKAFDLGVGEPLRVRLLELSSGSSLLVMTVHHIVCDRWSIGILIRELAALYRREGRPESLAALPIRYRDFATWQRQRWTPERLETALEYWRDRLSGELPSLELPLDRPRPKRAKREGRHLRLAVDSQAVPKLLRLCHEHGATAFTAWLALFKALLARTTGVEDLLVGAPDAGRDRPEVEGMVGYFVNTVVHRTDCGGDPSFRSLLDRVQQGVKADQGHRGIPFQKLVDDLRPERSPGLNPIFQVMLALQDLELPDFDLGPDCRGRIIDLPTGTAMFDLTLVVSGADAATETLWEYSTELFDHVTILRLAQRFRGLLQAVVADPDRPLWELPILGSGERQQLLVEWSRGQLRTPSERVSICGSFEAMVDRRSDAVAVILESEHVTYRELDRRSNRLARRLRALGVGAEVPVGVCLERSVQLVVGMLAILRAGGVYVPLEPETPEERLRTIARDAGLRWLLVNDASPIGSEVPALDLRSPDLEQPELDSQRLELQVDPQQLAYIIYTSGSTGRPNGVGVSHGAIAGHMGSVRSLYRTSVEDRVLQFTSANFDPAIEQTLNALTGGASLVLRGPDLWSRERLAEDSLNFGLSVFNFAPPVWRPLAGDWIAASGSQARLLILGADVLRADLVGELWRGLRVINAYGPTEAVITSVLFEVDDRGGRLPIGRPVGQRTARVLDRKGRLSPLGSAGELTHGGGQLARGYVGQPGLTAQRFIPDAFSRRYGSRCYRTGDRVRHLADGNLDFLGRSDQQVKIRGFRVEPSEIEARLLEMPTVQHAVVDVRGSGGERRLVAYLVTDGELPSAAELRRFVAARLSEYMVPSAFVGLDELPRLASGKVDRVGLPDPEPQVASRGEAPSGRAEEILADIWCEVFRLEKVGRDQSFFDLGGDSVLSIQVVSMAAARGLSLEPRQFFEHPTLAELASVAGEAERIEAEQGAVTGRVPLTPIQRWFFEQSFAAPEHWNQSVLLAIAEDLDPVILEPAVDALVSHHDALRHAFRQDLEGWRQEARPSSGVQRTLTIDLEALEARDRHRVRNTISNHLQASLDLASGSVFRVALFTPGVDGASELLLVAHHLIVDAVSWRLLLEDLGQLYQQREAG
ncbi:MAG: amino acid adenylation domain-containing protein, partial [Acidobacteriota bacterium]